MIDDSEKLCLSLSEGSGFSKDKYCKSFLLLELFFLIVGDIEAAFENVEATCKTFCTFYIRTDSFTL